MPSAPIFAIVTPFAKDGSVDKAALADSLAFLESGGAQRIVSGGTTGEFPSMTLAERQRLLELCRQSFRGEVIAHVSATCVADTAQLLRHAAETGANAALLLPPYYYREPSEAGVMRFYVDALAASSLPIYAYNFPRHTQFALQSEFLSKLAQTVPTLRGVKDSGGWPGAAPAIKSACPQLEVYVGADTAALDVLHAGLDGSVTGGANPVPRVLTALAEAWMSARPATPRLQALLNQWSEARRESGLEEIAAIKATLAALLPGFPLHVRPPLTAAAEPHRELARLAVELADQAEEILRASK